MSIHGSMPLARDTGQVVVVIPAFNEQRTIAEVVREVRACGHAEVVVVDDRSQDDTAAEAAAAGARVIRLHIRHGAWGAVQTGLRHAVSRGYRFAVTMDADGQHHAPAIAALLAALRTGEANVAIGSCLQRGSRLRMLAWKLLRAASGLDIEDLTSGFRVYDRAAMRHLVGGNATQFAYQDVGVLMLLKNAGMRLAEVSVPMSERRSGISRIYHSWLAVFGYMSQTLLLCVANLSLGWTAQADEALPPVEERGG